VEGIQPQTPAPLLSEKTPSTNERARKETTRTTGSTGTFFSAASALMTVVGFSELLNAPNADVPQHAPPPNSIPASFTGFVSVEPTPPASERGTPASRS